MNWLFGGHCKLECCIFVSSPQEGSLLATSQRYSTPSYNCSHSIVATVHNVNNFKFSKASYIANQNAHLLRCIAAEGTFIYMISLQFFMYIHVFVVELEPLEIPPRKIRKFWSIILLGTNMKGVVSRQTQCNFSKAFFLGVRPYCISGTIGWR